MIEPRQLVFDDAFLTGVDEIDDQHRVLVSLTNEVGRMLTQGPTRHQVEELVQELLSYAIYHFRTEEGLMQQYGYREYDDVTAQDHVRMHRDFAARIAAAQEDLQEHRFVDVGELQVYLVDWITQHILGTDKKLAEVIRSARMAAG